MSNIRVKAGTTGAEQMQYTQRARALGLEVKQGQIDPASAQNVKGGLAAVQALAKDGVLDGEGLAQLRQNKGFVASLLGRDMPISAKQTREVRALAMDLKGAAALVAKTEDEIRFREGLNNAMVFKVNEKLGAAVDKFNKVLGEGTDTLAQVDPKAARELAEAIGYVAEKMSSYSGLLSGLRSQLVGAYTDGFMARVQVNAIVSNVFASIDGNKQFQKLASIFTDPAPGTVTPAPSAGVQSLGRDFEAWRP